MGSIFAANCAKCHAGHRAPRRGGQQGAEGTSMCGDAKVAAAAQDDVVMTIKDNPRRATIMSKLGLSILLGLASLASTGLAAKNKCTVNRCLPAMKARCAGLHGKERRQCRKSIVAECRG